MESLEKGLLAYCQSWLVVAGGIACGLSVMEPSAGPHSPQRAARSDDALLDTLSLWDGQWYLQIADSGYNYQPDGKSSVAFFPAYPLLVAGVSKATGMATAAAGLVVSHVFLIGCFVMLDAYLRADRAQRARAAKADGMRSMPAMYTLLAFGLFPPTFFFRMVYSESLFVFAAILAMYGIKRDWRPWKVAVIVGACTAVRSAGVALVPPLALYIWRRAAEAGKRWGKLRRLVAAAGCGILLAPIALWGLIAYVAYQDAALGEPLAFVEGRGALAKPACRAP